MIAEVMQSKQTQRRERAAAWMGRALVAATVAAVSAGAWTGETLWCAAALALAIACCILGLRRLSPWSQT